MAPLRLDCPFPRARKGPVDGPVDEVPVVQRSVVLLKKEGLCVCVCVCVWESVCSHLTEQGKVFLWCHLCSGGCKCVYVFVRWLVCRIGVLEPQGVINTYMLANSYFHFLQIPSLLNYSDWHSNSALSTPSIDPNTLITAGIQASLNDN